jgi:hypothetical protein
MLKTRFAALVSCIFITIILICSGCGEALTEKQKPAETTTDTTFNTAVATTSTPISPDSIVASDLSAWKLTEAEAIAIASKYVPAEVVSHAKISAGPSANGNSKTGEIHYFWEVAFMNILVTKAWLGWHSDSHTTLQSDGPYNELVVYIDAVTGKYMSRMAYYAVFIGGPGMTPSLASTWVPSTTTGNP